MASLKRAYLSALCAASLVVFSSPAWAKPTFPVIVQKTLDLTCTPQCTLCHAGLPPAQANATKPFALNILKFAPGVGKDDKLLPDVLLLMETEPCRREEDLGCGSPMLPCVGRCNSDGQGDDDIAELRDNMNPNDSTVLKCPLYGCGAHVAPTRSSRPADGTAALLALGAAAVVLRRWRR